MDDTLSIVYTHEFLSLNKMVSAFSICIGIQSMPVIYLDNCASDVLNPYSASSRRLICYSVKPNTFRRLFKTCSITSIVSIMPPSQVYSSSFYYY